MTTPLDQPLLEAIVSKVTKAILHLPPDNRLAYTESEAAMLLGMPDHVLRDTRTRGEIRGKKIGKRIYYAKDALIQFLASQP